MFIIFINVIDSTNFCMQNMHRLYNIYFALFNKCVKIKVSKLHKFEVRMSN